MAEDKEKKIVGTEESVSDRVEAEIVKSARKKKMRKRIRTIVIWVILIAIVATMVLIYQKKSAETAAKIAEMQETVEVTEKVKETSYQVAIDISSFVEPYQIQEAKFRTGGAVTGVFVEEGDYVKKGDLLASIDDSNQVAQLSSVRNQIKEAEMTGNKRNLEQLRLQEKNAINAVDYCNIYANFDGVVTSVLVHEGDYFDPGSKVLTLVDVSKLKATVEVDEIDMQYVEEGMKAYLSFDSVPGKMVEGYVSYIPMLGHYSASSGIGVVDVEITVPEPPKGVVPGFSFDGKILVNDEVKMIIVPQAAVKSGRGGVNTVKVRTESGDEERAVTVKYLGENLVQIQSENLQPGETIVYEKTKFDAYGMGMGGFGGMRMGF